MSALAANLPEDALEPITSVAKTGIYFGYAQVLERHQGPEEKGTFQGTDLEVQPMVMSLGWNPYYKNEKMTAVSICSSTLQASTA